jgi:hypothetical protein
MSWPRKTHQPRSSIDHQVANSSRAVRPGCLVQEVARPDVAAAGARAVDRASQLAEDGQRVAASGRAGGRRGCRPTGRARSGRKGCRVLTEIEAAASTSWRSAMGEVVVVDDAPDERADPWVPGRGRSEHRPSGAICAVGSGHRCRPAPGRLRPRRARARARHRTVAASTGHDRRRSISTRYGAAGPVGHPLQRGRLAGDGDPRLEPGFVQRDPPTASHVHGPID